MRENNVDEISVQALLETHGDLSVSFGGIHITKLF